MKRILLFAVLLMAALTASSQTNCHMHIDCDFESRCLMPQEGMSYSDQSPGQFVACKGTTVTYSAIGDCDCDTVYPYEWNVQGADSFFAYDNKVSVTWGGWGYWPY